jgi:voltage-gated chloride channel
VAPGRRAGGARLALAVVVVGVGAGLGAIVFRFLILGVTRLRARRGRGPGRGVRAGRDGRGAGGRDGGPITAIVIVAEITGEWDLVVPLMIAVVLATLVSRGLSSDTIYTLKLTRRGIRLHPPACRAGRGAPSGRPCRARRRRVSTAPPAGSGLPADWAPPAGFVRLEGTERLLVGPRAGLEDLVRALPEDRADPHASG